MVAGLLLPTHPTIDARIDEIINQAGGDQQMVQAHAVVGPPSIAKVGPEGPKRSDGMLSAQRVGPALVEQAAEGGPAFRRK